MNLTMPFFMGRTRENMEADICINQSKANQRNSSRKGTFCLNYGANYLGPPLQCSWGDLAYGMLFQQAGTFRSREKMCYCNCSCGAWAWLLPLSRTPVGNIQAQTSMACWGKKGSFRENHHGLHAGKRRMSAPKEATLGCFLKIFTTLALS